MMGQGTNSEAPQTSNQGGTVEKKRELERRTHLRQCEGPRTRVPLGKKLPQSPFMGQAIKKLKLFTQDRRRRLNLTRPTRFNQLLLLSVPEQGERGAILGDTATATTIAYLSLARLLHLLPFKVAERDSKFSRGERR